jgi:glycosidase
MTNLFKYFTFSILLLIASINLNASYLHVPSPEWRDQIIYFIMTDRFNDGNPQNNNQNCEEYNPEDSRKFSGGDLKGIIDKIDYIKDLGATAVWITPPIANQWWDPQVQYGGYHGYWGENFKEVDKHFGTLEEYKKLSNALHKDGMYLIQDIVPNHTGNYFGYKGKYESKNPKKNFVKYTKTPPVKAPTQYPFNMNDINKSKDREAEIYHWTPIIENFNNKTQKLTYQLANLDDINTSNPFVRKVLKDTYGYWIKEVGVDAFRIDTVIYVEHDFWYDFINGENGINKQAKETGRNRFFTFGEAFVGSEPLKDNGEKDISSYMGTKDKPEMNAVLNFPLYFTINKVFAEGKPTNLLSYRLKTAQNNMLFPNPYIIPKFIDNHDVPRFLAKGSVDGLKQALALIMTTPGIPVIYYGTEQGFNEQRASMFSNGYGSNGKEHFDKKAPLYKFIQKMTQLRKNNDVLRRGKLEILKDTESGSGILAYSMKYKKDQVIVIFNTSAYTLLVPEINTELAEGTILTPIYSDKTYKEVTVGENGIVTEVLPPKAILILKVSNKISPEKKIHNSINITSNIENKTIDKSMLITGKADNTVEILAVVDGNIDNSQKVKVTENRWSFNFDLNNFATGKVKHNLIMYDPKTNSFSKTYNFYTDIKFPDIPVQISKNAKSLSNLKLKNYGTPHDKSYNRDQMEIEDVKIFTADTNLKISIQMKELSQLWNPDNGFDHVCFNIYIDLPDKKGCKILPRINAPAPLNFEWNYMSFTQGWTNGIYSASGASKNNWGSPVEPAPKIKIDKDKKMVSFLYCPEALGYPKSLIGSKIFITTWDFDNGYRKLTKEGGPWSFSGGDENNPLIMDCTPIITIK